jgi:hypothetical protein
VPDTTEATNTDSKDYESSKQDACIFKGSDENKRRDYQEINTANAGNRLPTDVGATVRNATPPHVQQKKRTQSFVQGHTIRRKLLSNVKT